MVILFVFVTQLQNKISRFIEYRLKPAYQLLQQGKLGYLVGVVCETIIDWNIYLWWLQHRGSNFFRTVDIMGLDMTVDLKDHGLGRHLYIRGEHEPLAAEAMRRELIEICDKNSSSIVFDIGANIGYYALQEASITEGQVFAIEPDDENRKLLSQNIAQNGFTDQIKIVPVAIGEKNGTAQFLKSKKSNWNRINADRDHRFEDITDTSTVDVRTIDSLLTEHTISPEEVGAIRMDLEGHESAVFRGMETILESETSLVMFVEFHPERLNDDRFESMLSSLEENSFEICHVDQDRSSLPITDFEQLHRVDGTHVRVVFRRS